MGLNTKSDSHTEQQEVAATQPWKQWWKPGNKASPAVQSRTDEGDKARNGHAPQEGPIVVMHPEAQ